MASNWRATDKATWIFSGSLFLSLLLAGYLLFMPAYLQAMLNVYFKDPLSALLYGLTLLFIGGLLLISLRHTPRLLDYGRQLIQKMPRLAVWGMVLILWMRMLQFGYLLAAEPVDPLALLPFYAWGIVIGLVIIGLKERRNTPPASRESPQATLLPPARKKRLWLITWVFAALAFARDAVLVWAFSYGFNGDSTEYIQFGAQFLEKSASVFTRRPMPYPLLNAITNSAQDPWPLIWLQVLIGALAVGALVYAIGRSDLVLAGTVGVFLALDLVWGSNNRQVLTEGPFTSFFVLSLAALINHYERRHSLRAWELVVGGVLYSWTVFFRPSNIPLLLLLVLAYFVFTRSWRKTAWVLTGMLVIFVASYLLNFYRSGSFQLVSYSGLPVSFPLFSYHLFSPENGPVSAALDQHLRDCYPDLDYNVVGMDNNNEIILRQFFPCLEQSGLTLEDISNQFFDAYREAITSQPIRFGRSLLRENSLFLAFPVTRQVLITVHRDTNECSGNWCLDAPAPRFGANNPLLWMFSGVTSYTTQVYMLLAPSFLHAAQASPWPISAGPAITMAAAWLMMVGFLLLTTRGTIRFIVLACLIAVHYISFSVITGHIFIGRYATVLSPVYIFLSITTVTIIWRALWQESGALRQAAA